MKKLLLCLALLLCACQKKEEVVSNENSSIVYEIFPYSFYDTDENGVGDLKGITEKLDYIQSLGAGYIWLTPITKSPTYHKYDVVNYMEVDPMFGNLEDFDTLVSEAEKRNIGIVFDLVLNHTSSQHPWFIQAKEDVQNNRCEEEGNMCDWYNFSSEKKTGYTSMGKNQYYESVFWSEMPDLNLDNEEVRQEIEKIVKFWIDHGVAGFRLDASLHYYGGNATKNNEFLTWLEEMIHSYDEDSFLVSEVWSDTSTIRTHYESGFDSFFNFPASGTTGSIVSSIRGEEGATLASWMVRYHNTILEKNPEAIDSVFLSNHDQGRSGAFFANNPEKAKLMASVLLLSPGRVYMYYGEEIGMLGSGDDPNKRLAMLWDTQDKTGIPYNPPGANYSSQIDSSVKDQLKDSNSLLNHYKKIASIRNKSTLYETGKIEAINVNNETIYAMKIYENDQALYVIHNFSGETQTISWNQQYASYDTTNSQNHVKDEQITLAGYSSVVLYE